MTAPLDIAVLMGGWAHEREVSLVSGAACADALEERGHRVTRIDMGRDVAARLAEAAPDIVFNALHGVPGEDGAVQGMLDLMGLAYTHSGMASSVLAIDKQLTKQALVPHGVPMPGGRVVASASLFDGDPLPRPYVVKPINEGSSVGVAILEEGGGPIARGTPGPWRDFAELLIEPFIRGRELTASVLEDEDGPRALGVTELRPKSGFYDYAGKYTDGLVEHLCPAPLPPAITRLAEHYALEAHRLLGCSGCSRSDFRWDDERGEEGLFLIEINTQPGMTALSLLPEQAAAQGIGFGDLLEAIVAAGLRRQGRG